MSQLQMQKILKMMIKKKKEIMKTRWMMMKIQKMINE